MVEYEKYKGLIMAALDEASRHNILGSIGDAEARSLYNRLKYDDYCTKRGINYDDMTPEDFEEAAMKEMEEHEAEMDYEDVL